MEELEGKIINLFKNGYTITEIMNEMHDEFRADENKYFTFVKKTIEKTRAGMSQEEKEELALIRKQRAESERNKKIIDVATQVKDRVEADNSTVKQSDKLIQAIKMVAMKTGIKYDTVRTYTKNTFPCFFQEYSNNTAMDEKYFISLANKIIDNDIAKSDAIKMIGYKSMIAYLEEHNPDLLVKINDVYASHIIKHRPTLVESNHLYNRDIFNPKNKKMLIAILLEFRVPYAVAAEFINNYKDLFLLKGGHVDLESFKDDLIVNSFDDMKPLFWYFYEMAGNDEFTDARINRFDEFVAKFDLLKDNEEKREKFVKFETRNNLGFIEEKVKELRENRSLNFEKDEVRKMIKFIYKRALTDEEAEVALKTGKLRKSQLLEWLGDAENIEDMILIRGLEKLNDYHQNKASSYGRK